MYLCHKLTVFFLPNVSSLSAYTGCSGAQYECDNGDCVPSEVLCDGKDDCTDDSDEEYCGKTNSSWSTLAAIIQYIEDLT